LQEYTGLVKSPSRQTFLTERIKELKRTNR